MSFFFQCEICQLSKHHHASFSPQPYKASKPSLWFIGMFRDLVEFLQVLKKKWFVTFIDDHTRLTWVYLMKEKSKVETIFKLFYTMVQTQFHKKIQIFRSDNGKEYFNKILGSFFLENKYCSSKLLQWYSLTKWVSWKKKKTNTY